MARGGDARHVAAQSCSKTGARELGGCPRCSEVARARVPCAHTLSRLEPGSPSEGLPVDDAPQVRWGPVVMDVHELRSSRCAFGGPYRGGARERNERRIGEAIGRGRFRVLRAARCPPQRDSPPSRLPRCGELRRPVDGRCGRDETARGPSGRDPGRPVARHLSRGHAARRRDLGCGAARCGYVRLG